MKEKDFKSSVEKMLLKKAMGFKVKENVDEYASVGEEMKLVKRRIRRLRYRCKHPFAYLRNLPV